MVLLKKTHEADHQPEWLFLKLSTLRSLMLWQNSQKPQAKSWWKQREVFALDTLRAPRTFCHYMASLLTGDTDTNSSDGFIRTEGLECFYIYLFLYLLIFFYIFVAFFIVLLWSNQRTSRRNQPKVQHHESIRITYWPNVRRNIFPQLLFDWSEVTRGKIPTKFPYVNKGR